MAKKKKKDRPDHGNGRFAFIAAEPTLFSRVAILSAYRAVGTRRGLASADDLMDAGTEVLKAWHGLVERLTPEHGFADEFRLKLLRCPPASILVRHVGFAPLPCQLRALCPFCRGRHAARVWSRLDDLMFPAPKGAAKPEVSTYDLLTHHRRLDLPEACVDPALGLDASGLAAACALRTSVYESDAYPVGRRGYETRQAKAYAGFEEMAVGFAEAGGYSVEINWVMALAPDATPACRRPRCTYWESRRPAPERKEVANAVIGAFRYPPGLLAATPEQLHEYLRALKNARRFSAVGALRPSRRAKAAARTEE